MLMFIIGLLLMFGNTLPISGTSSCPDKQVEHRIPETKELRCCFPVQIKIGHELIPCLKNGTNDTQKLCGELEYQPDEGSSLNEYFCYDVKVALNCDTVETVVITHGSQKKCMCNLERGYCGLDHLLCQKIELLNCPRYVHQDCTCIQPTSSPTVTSKEKRPSNTTTSGTVHKISDSQQVPTIQVQPGIDEKKPDEPQVRHKEDEITNKEVQKNVTSSSWHAYLAIGIITGVIIVGTAVILSCCILWRGLQWSHIAEYVCSQGDGRNSVCTTTESTSINDSVETVMETASRQTHRKQVKDRGGGVSSGAKIPLLRSSKSKDSSKPMAVVSPTIIPTKFSSASGNTASSNSIEEIQRPEFDSNIHYTLLCTRSLENADMISGETMIQSQSPETSVAQQAGESSEVSQSREVTCIQETRKKTAAYAESARVPSNFGHNTEFRTNSDHIQQLTKGNGATCNGGTEVRAERSLNGSCLEGNKRQDNENTELKVVKPDTAANCKQRISLMEGAGMPITNELIQSSITNGLEPQSLAKVGATSDTLNLAFHSVVRDPRGAQPEESEQLCSNNESRDLVNYSNNETSNSYQSLMISNLHDSLSADSLEETDSD